MQYCHIPLMPRQWNLAGHQQTQSTSVRLTDVAMLGGTMSGHSCAPWHYRSGELLQTIEWCHCKLHFVRLSAGLYMSEETVWLLPSPGKLCNATRLSVCLLATFSENHTDWILVKIFITDVYRWKWVSFDS